MSYLLVFLFKAFDFANRPCLILELMHDGCGKCFSKAVAYMCKSTSYTSDQ